MKDTLFTRRTAHATMKLQRTLGTRPRDFCLITGAPRSGTTAIANWLSGQPRVAGLSESRILVAAHRLLEEIHRFRSLADREKALVANTRKLIYDYYARSEILFSRNILIDKEPLEPIAFPDKRYDKFLENTTTLLPGARFLFMVRDPLATVWSMTQRKWGYSLANAEPTTYSIREHTENWCACAEIALRVLSRPNTYICQYGKLVAAPDNESARIFKFLNIKGRAFEPRQATKEPEFSSDDREWIVQATQDKLEKLAAQGISDL